MTTEQSPIASLAEIRALRQNLPGRDEAAEAEAQRRNAILTKPPGALADLEDIAIFMAGWQARALPEVNHPRTAVFAGNHGVAAQGVSAFPAEVTAQMVLDFQAGGAAVNQLVEALDGDLMVYEMALDVPTADFTQGPAMSDEECAQAMAYGMMAVEPGVDLLMLGEMGIANTTSAAAIYHALYGGGRRRTGPAPVWRVLRWRTRSACGRVQPARGRCGRRAGCPRAARRENRGHCRGDPGGTDGAGAEQLYLLRCGGVLHAWALSPTTASPGIFVEGAR